MARPTKLDSQVAGRICHHVRLGDYPEVAAAFAGIARSTFLKWIQDTARTDAEILDRIRTRPYAEYERWLDNVDEWMHYLGWTPDPRASRRAGRRARLDRWGQPRPTQPETLRPKSVAAWVGFSDSVARAEAEAEIRQTRQVSRGADTDWKAAAFLLERRAPRRWGSRSRVELTDGEGGALPIAPAALVVWHLPYNNRDPVPPIGRVEHGPYIPPPDPDELPGE